MRGGVYMSESAAFFDIDGTISREGLICEMFHKMIQYELIDSSKWDDEVEPAYRRWDRREGDYDTYLKKMVDIYSDTVVGVNRVHIEYIAKRVVEQKGQRVYTYTRDKMKWHREQGHKVIAISGSPYELVSHMCAQYKMDDCRGTIYNVDKDGLYTGEIIPMWNSVSKRAAIDELCQKYDLDLAKCYAYGDTTGDFSMFKLVGHSTAINPTRELLDKILSDDELRRRIEIIVERKDTTYRLDPTTIDLV